MLSPWVRRRRTALVCVCALFVFAAPAAAAPRLQTVRYGPITLNPYEAKRGDFVYDIPKPAVDGYITTMKARLVYRNGREVPIANTMIHHVLFSNVGTYMGEQRDATCARIRMYDSRTYQPALASRFYALGEERHELRLPLGYGYRTRAVDRWALTYMLMNHRRWAETVFLEYTMTIETERELTPITPVWLDPKNCSLDGVYDIPGGGSRGSTSSASRTWTAPAAGRLVFGTGHLHGGGREVRLTRPDCGNRTVFLSKPLWGAPDHPYYRVRPLLHEPGPISMTSFQSEQGIPVAAGERLKMTAVYDNERPHVRVMGIGVMSFVRDDRVTQQCSPLPGDMRTFQTATRGRTRTPRVTVPLTSATEPRGRARVITRPPGPTVALRGGGLVELADTAFSPANVELPAGGVLRWRFFDADLHNVTLASGPRGFSSDAQGRGGSFAYRFTRPGTYRVFCTLHPVTMSATVRVRGGGGA